MNRRKFLTAGTAFGASAVITSSFSRRARSANRQLNVLVTGSPPDPAVHYLYYAQLNGFFKDLDVKFSTFNAETTVTRALVAGEGDVAWTGVVSTMQAIATGAKLRCIDGITPKTDWVVIAKKDITDPKQLEGRSFAVSAVGAVSYVGPKLWLDNLKVDSNKVNWIGIGGSGARVQALLAKQIDATALTPAFAVRALQQDFLYQIGDLAKDLPRFGYCLDMASIDAIERKPEALAAFVAGATRAAHWANDNPKDAALASAKLLPDVSLDLLQAAADAHTKSKFYNFDVVYSPEDFRFMYDSSVALGQMKPGMKYEDFFDPRPIAAARRM